MEISYVIFRTKTTSISIKTRTAQKSIKIRKNIDNPVNIKGLDSSLVVKINQEKFKVLITGTEKKLLNINEDDIYLYIDLFGYTEGSFDVPINVEINELVSATLIERLVSVEIIKK